MSKSLPPPPLGSDFQAPAWNSWFVQVKSFFDTLKTFAWSLIDFTGSNITDILTRKHRDLQDLQGGTTGEYYHTTFAQHTSLLGSGDSSLHYHSSDRDRANHTGTQTLSTISDAGTAASESGLSIIIVTAKLTALGTNGSMTFTNGVLTAQIAAT